MPPGCRAWRPSRPAPTITNVAVVEMLNVFSLSPPVPHVSTRLVAFGRTLTAFSRITLTNPVISSTVSPFIRIAVMKRRHLRGRGFAVHDLGHGGDRFGFGQVQPLNNFSDRFSYHLFVSPVSPLARERNRPHQPLLFYTKERNLSITTGVDVNKAGDSAKFLVRK